MSENKNSEAEDVFEFLDSLPEAKNGGKMVNTDVKGSQEGVKGGSNSVAGKTGNDGKKGDDDIFEFLEELEKSNLSLTDKKGVEKKAPSESVNNKAQDEKVEESKENKNSEQDAHGKEKEPQQQEKEEEEEEEEETPLHDPIASISNWWSSSGSAKVSSIWNKTAEQASQIKNRLAQEQLDLTSKINTSTITEIARNLQKIVVGETEEVLRIHLVHDLVNYPSLQYNIESKFDQVLSSQVEGGIRIFVDEWGHPNNNGITPVEKKPSVADGELGNSKKKLQFNLFDGKVTDGEKLAFANLENAVKLFNTAHEEYQKQQKEADATPDDDRSSISSNSNKISDLFISILPIAIPQKQKDADGDFQVTDSNTPGNFNFTLVLKDITNDITTITRSQGFPVKWVNWLEGSVEKTGSTASEERNKSYDQKKQKESEDEDEDDEIIDPSEWVKEWIEDGLSLSFGVMAQNYVIDRMGL
ncbi:CDG_1a_G0028830.mRNA.1.CDS.1 [Saccharomyces cerevisiae]|nr:CDG_1a_G0028830.mRNA.1.CDS.1 [Saccharomyces cerevisiae]CAI7352432.1 CDG_1a_G0028830.mRNA.1.CDS.1 [Saccharomyces cerevisiae]